MKNKYPGQCVDCGKTVAAGAGKAFKAGKRWVVSHEGRCASAAPDREPTFKERFGRCEDAPCCGCCGNGQESYSFNNYSDPF